MDFVTIKVTCSEAFTEILMVALFELGFDSFQELGDGFEGSCEHKQFNQKALEDVLNNYTDVAYTLKEEDKTNWNEAWEKNYDPIIVGDKCIVRATFHKPQPQFPYEIIVTPKMSFGTGHHATTYQVLDYQTELNHTDKKVLDVGTGTGILAIMASKRGASRITATDIDDWCIENSEENFALNEVKGVKIIKGQIEQVEESDYDLIFANINKNVLLDQIKSYAARLKPSGKLILSGFYDRDIADLKEEAKKYGLVEDTHTVRDQWAMLALIDPSV